MRVFAKARHFLKSPRRSPRDQASASILMSWVRAQSPIGTHTESPVVVSKSGRSEGDILEYRGAAE